MPTVKNSNEYLGYDILKGAQINAILLSVFGITKTNTWHFGNEAMKTSSLVILG